MALSLALSLAFSGLLFTPFWIVGWVQLEKGDRVPREGPHNGYALMVIHWRRTRIGSILMMAVGSVVAAVLILLG